MRLNLPSFVRLVATLVILALAIFLTRTVWKDYMYSPWTRDGRVRANVVSVAPDVAGLVTEVRVVDNQRVRKGDVLFVIDPARFGDALAQSEAEVARAREQVGQAKALVTQRASELAMRRQQSARRAELAGDIVSEESRANVGAQATQAQAAHTAAQAGQRAAEASLRAAEAGRAIVARNLARSAVKAPANGYITNLTLHPGDYVAAGAARMALVDEDSFWVYGYFEETKLPQVQVGDTADIQLMGGQAPLKGRVESIASGIVDRDNVTGAQGLANVNPVFTWVRLAQRVPVRIALEDVPDNVHLAAGMTATVTLHR